MPQAKRANPKIHHINLKTTRLPEMLAWHSKVLGMEVHFRNEIAAWASNDEANHRIAFLAVAKLEDDSEKIKHKGMHHIAFEYASLDELMRTYEELRAEGIDPEFCLDHGLTTSLYYFDPDGNGVELQIDNFGDWAQSKNFLQTSEAFAANPIGVFFDPARFNAAYKSEPSLEKLRARVTAGEFTPDPLPGLRIPQ